MKIFTLLLIFGLLHPVYSKNITEYVQGEGSTREEAIQNALMNGMNEYYGVTLGSKVTLNSGRIAENKTVIVRKDEGIRYKVTDVGFKDKYKSTYRASLKITFQRFTPSDGFWRSAVIPGWGQYYKGSSVKGTIALTGTSGLLIGAILSANHSKEMDDQATSSRSQFKRDYYFDEATKYHQLSLILYGLTAGFYALNIFDAVSSPVGYSYLSSDIFGGVELRIEPVCIGSMIGFQLSFSSKTNASSG